MEKLKKGFYTALGTPLREDGTLYEESLIKEINMQIESGASGLLLMGSMGMETAIADDTYIDAVKCASEAVAGRTPLFVGVMDNSARRVLDRIERIKDFEFEAVVLTTPFYETSNEENLINFFEMIADESPKPVFLYDLPVITKQKITFSMLKKLSGHPNICGIKSGDIVLARLAKRNIPDFEFLFSNLDIFDIAISYGIDKVLDGMFSATPVNGKGFAEALKDGDIEKCGKYLDNILYLRDTFIEFEVFPAFTVSMNMLGMDGSFSLDYEKKTDAVAEIREAMVKIGEIRG